VVAAASGQKVFFWRDLGQDSVTPIQFRDLGMIVRDLVPVMLPTGPRLVIATTTCSS